MELFLYYMGAACWVAFVYVAWTILEWVWFTPKRIEKCLRQQGFSGNSYKLLFGDMKESSKLIKHVNSTPISLHQDYVPRVYPVFDQAIKAYGKNCFVWFGPKAAVNIMDVNLVKEILTKSYQFQKPKVNPLVRLLVAGLTDHEGDKWAKHRKIINPAFHIKKLKNMVPAFGLSSSEMLRKWDEKIGGRELGSEIDVWPYLQALTSDAISRTSFGSNYEEGKHIFELQKKQAHFAINHIINPLYIPGSRFLPTKKNRIMKEIDNKVRASLLDIINKRVAGMNAGERSKDDLLGMLLDSNIKEIKRHGNDKNVGMTIDEVIEECKLFYFAGQETTSVLLTWTLVLLSSHQDWQQRARDEVLQVFGQDMPNFDGLSRLKVVTMVLYEVLRFYTPVVALVRTVNEDTELVNILIPSGALIFIPAVLIHRDPTIWGDDANEFKPERFSEGVSKATKNKAAFFPFSWGPRVCIGQNFAMLQAKMVLAMLLRRFSFEISPSYTHAPMNVVTVQPQHGSHLIVRNV